MADESKRMLMKLDYNNLVRNIDETLSASRSRVVKENAFGIAIGINLLTEYLKRIAERSIEINDEILIELLKDLHVLKESED